MPRQERIAFPLQILTCPETPERVARSRGLSVWSVLFSLVLHGALAGLVFAGGSGLPAGLEGTGGGGLAVIEVGLASFASASGQPVSERQQVKEPAAAVPAQPETVVDVDNAVPVRVARLAPVADSRKQPPARTKRKTPPQRTRASSPAVTGEAKTETTTSPPRETTDAAIASAGGTPGLERGDGGIGAAATPGTVAGDGRPFGFSLGEVSGKPQVLQSVPVVYPLEARKKRITGLVLVRFHLDEKGAVSHLHVKRAEPPVIFNQNALNSLRKWRFRPASHAGKSVPVWVELPIEFDLR